jgi:methylated-DNA-[protein]-cysteine S-methyltransferase
MINPHIYSAIFSSPLGPVGLIMQEDKLTTLELLDNSAPLKKPRDTYSQEIAEQLAAYFKNPQQPFRLDLTLTGTPFQKKVWQAVQNIGPGKTKTYGQLAKELASAPRAIGQACKSNPIVIIVPCHRVVAANDVGGYAGARDGIMR